jgi:hypothetical protein
MATCGFLRPSMHASYVCPACSQASVLVFLLAVLIIAAAGLEVVFGGRSALTDLIHRRHVGFNALCHRRM